MDATTLLDTLRFRGVTLTARGDRLTYRPLDAVTPDLLAALREHKADLLTRLAPPPGPDPAAAFEGLVNRALDELTRRYVPGALAWVSEHRLDLSREIADAALAVGGLDRWKPFGPEQLAGLRALLVRWYRAQSAGLDAFRNRPSAR